MRAWRTLTSMAATAAALALSAGAANATSWDLTQAADGNVSGLLNNGSVASWTVGGSTISAEAFSLYSSSGTTGQAQLGIYTGTGFGIGVTSAPEPSGSSPQHTVSNETNHDFVAFQVPTSFSTGNNTLSLTITLNQFCSDGNRYGNACSAHGVSGTDNFDLYVGTSSLATINTNATKSGETLTQLTTGFQHVTSTSVTSGSHSGDETVTINGLQAGDTILIAAALLDGVGTGNGNDYFKIAGITANSVPKPVPEPGTLAVFGVGIAGLVALRRRRRHTA